MLNNLVVFVKQYIPKKTGTPLGRWNLDYFKEKVDNKIDLANEDHCGVCSEYSKEKMMLVKNKNDF